MKKSILIVSFVLFSIVRLLAQGESTDAEFYSPEFKWRISIPPDFQQVDPLVWDQQKVAVDSLWNDTIEVENKTRTIVVFKSNAYNYFESNWQPYDKTERGDFNEHCRLVGEQLYRTFAGQIPDAKIDTASGSQQVNSLLFRKFVVKMSLPNGVTLNSYMYSHLFGDKEFSANLFYVNDEQGSMLMEAWLYSRFNEENQ